MKKISEFLSENFQVLVVKFSIYLNRRVFVMNGIVSLQAYFIFGLPCFEQKYEKNIRIFI